MELAGAARAGDAPAWAPLLLALRVLEKPASTDAVYAPISSAFPPVTLYYHQDGLLHKVTGAAPSPSARCRRRHPDDELHFHRPAQRPHRHRPPRRTLSVPDPVPITDAARPRLPCTATRHYTMGGFNIDLGNEVTTATWSAKNRSTSGPGAKGACPSKKPRWYQELPRHLRRPHHGRVADDPRHQRREHRQIDAPWWQLRNPELRRLQRHFDAQHAAR